MLYSGQMPNHGSKYFIKETILWGGGIQLSKRGLYSLVQFTLLPFWLILNKSVNDIGGILSQLKHQKNQWQVMTNLPFNVFHPIYYIYCNFIL
uniref:Uncharacterized protein n=1 Tax=Lactuca sativa TaxID=4236 RepID=A0A9R1VF97_LACSA|nr:hypothetical protein LSAT_V11C500293300 [Lactuca sativa]